MQPALAFSNQNATANDAGEEAERSSERRIVRSASTVLRHLGEDAPSSRTPSSNYLEVPLPMRLSHKWVAYACRTAGVAKPRWNRVTSVWATSARNESGRAETIAITASGDGMRIRILAELADPFAESEGETTTARRLATAFVTTMRDGMRRRTVMRETYAELSRVAGFRNDRGTAS